MELSTLQAVLGLRKPFKPMDERDWMTFGGANPGTYVSYDEVSFRVAFAEPNGDVCVIYSGPSYEGDDEINFNVGPLSGFSDNEVKANAEYHKLG